MVTPIVTEIVPSWMKRPLAELPRPALEDSTSASAAPVEASAERS